MKELWLKCDINYVTEDYNIFLWVSVLSNDQKWNIILMGNKSFSCHQTKGLPLSVETSTKKARGDQNMNLLILTVNHLYTQTKSSCQTQTTNITPTLVLILLNFSVIESFYWEILSLVMTTQTKLLWHKWSFPLFIYFVCLCVRKIKFTFCLMMLSIGLVKNRSQLDRVKFFYMRDKGKSFNHCSCLPFTKNDMDSTFFSVTSL